MRRVLQNCWSCISRSLTRRFCVAFPAQITNSRVLRQAACARPFASAQSSLFAVTSLLLRVLLPWLESPTSRPMQTDAAPRPPAHRWQDRSDRSTRAFGKPSPALRSWGAHRKNAQSEGPKPHHAVGEFLFGTNPVLCALRSGSKKRAKFHALYALEGSSAPVARRPRAQTGKMDERKEIETLARALSIPVHFVSRHELNLRSENRPHNGFVLDCAPIQPQMLTSLPAPAGPADLWVLLDEVTDPQNLGAIIRSCSFFGVTGVVVCEKNSASLTPVVSKASSGAVEVMPVFYCKSTTQFISRSKQHYDAWRVVGMSLDDGARDCKDLPAGARPTLVVVGNEGYGLRSVVKQQCDIIAAIAGAVAGAGSRAPSSASAAATSAGPAGAPSASFASSLSADDHGEADAEAAADSASNLDSLNVSNAVSIVLYQLSSSAPRAEQ